MLEQAISRKPLQHPQTKSGAADSASGKCQAGNIIKRRSGRDFAPITAAAQFPNLTELDLCDSIEVGHRQLQWNPAQTGCRAGPRAPRLTDADVDTEVQPILLASHLREPGDIPLGVVAAHVDHRHLGASPTVWDARARRGDASIPLFECHLELGNGEWLCDRHLVLRAFTGFPLRLVLRQHHANRRTAPPQKRG